MNKINFKRLFFISLLIGTLINCMTSCTGLIRKEAPANLITILGTADLQGILDPFDMNLDSNNDGKEEPHKMGGISRIATLIHQAKIQNPGNVFAVSLGDDLMNRYFHVYKGEAIFKTMSMAGYDLYAFGNHEFDKGPEILADSIKKSATFEFICSDLHINGTVLDGLCQKTVIKETKGIKIGFFSLMTEDFPLVTSGKDVKLAQNNIDSARWAVSELKKNGANIIVALTHIGFNKDIEIAKQIQDIDVIFGSHSHDFIKEMKIVGKTIVINGGEKGVFMPRLDLVLTSSGTIDIEKTKFNLIPVDESIPTDTNIDKLLAQYQQNFPQSVELGKTEQEWNLTKEALRRGESVVANLINDLMLKKFNADIVLNNAGAFRGKRIYPPGPVTDTMLKEIDEFGNYAYTLEIKGKYIKEILERSAACYDEGGFLHGSGIRYTIDLKRPAQKISIDKQGKTDVTSKGSRVKNIMILDKKKQWKKLILEKNYKVLCNSYLVDQEGDGYFWFKRFGKNQNNTYSTFYSIMVEFVEANHVLTPQKPDKRITVLNK